MEFTHRGVWGRLYFCLSYYELVFVTDFYHAHKGPFINYVTLKGREGISQCNDVYIKHTSVCDKM